MKGLKFLRIKKGIKQVDLARKLKLKQSTISSWENGKSTCRSEMLPDLAKALECKIDDLFEEGE